jgi:hypothetical protein
MARRDFAPTIPAFACIALIFSSLVVAQKKRLWNDEILSLVLLQDPSFSHMLRAWGDTFNQAPPLYFILGWGWDKFLGSSDLSLRLFGSVCLCTGLLVTWRCLSRVWGSLSAAIGVISIYCISWLVLYHNTEARMYGLFAATCAIGLYIYQELAAQHTPSRALLVVNALGQGAIVLTHLYGILYSFAFLVSLIFSDITRGRLRIMVYTSFLGGWAFLIPFIPGLINQANNHARWRRYIRFDDFITFYDVRAEFGLYLLLVFALYSIMHIMRGLYPKFTKCSDTPVKVNPQAELDILLVGITFLTVPLLPWVITVTIEPMLSERYVIPTVTIGLPVIISHCIWKLFFAQQRDSNTRRSLIAVLLTGPALAYPLWTAYNFPFESPPGQNDAAFGYLDLPIAMEAGHDYLPRMHYSAHPERYFHIRDWDTAVKNTSSRIATGDYTHLAALNRHYPYVQSVESGEFLSKHNRFLVWNESDQKWFEWRVLSDPNYTVRILGTDRAFRRQLELYLVEKK